MACHRTLWVCDEMNSDSDVSALFMSVSEEREEEKGVDKGKGKEKSWGGAKRDD